MGMSKYPIFLEKFTTPDEKLIHQEISKLKKINYNKFYWWRNYTPKNEPLKSKDLLDKIKNGDYNFSHYYWQAYNAILKAKNKINLEYDDLETQAIKVSLEMEQYRKLIKDFEKDEFEKLIQLEKEFINNFNLSKEKYNYYFENYDGTLEEFYIFCVFNFGKRIKPLNKRGRKPKTTL
jgi:hypothetical protein